MAKVTPTHVSAREVTPTRGDARGEPAGPNGSNFHPSPGAPGAIGPPAAAPPSAPRPATADTSEVD